jgi:hypothetical protein
MSNGERLQMYEMDTDIASFLHAKQSTETPKVQLSAQPDAESSK